MATYEETLYDKPYPPFYPEDYGTVDGTPAHDTAAVQGAINAAVAAGAGRVVCNGTYELQLTGTLDSAISPCTYALWVNGDNVGIEGTGTLRLNATAVPGTGNFVAVLFGNGGSTGAQGIPYSTGTWHYNNWIKNVHINGTALTAAQRQAISTNHTSAVVNFMYCKNFLAQGVTITDGWGGNCALGSQASSRSGRFDTCRIESMVTGTGHGAFAFWFDGGQDIILKNSYANAKCAVTFQSNMDNCLGDDRTGICQNCTMQNNEFVGLGDPTGRFIIECSGASNILIDGNSFTSAAGQWYGSSIKTFDTPRTAEGRSDNVVFSNNTFTSASDTPWAFYITGIANDQYTAGTDPVYIDGFRFQGNTLTGFTQKGWFYNQYCQNAIVSGNTYNGNPTTYGYTNAGDEAAIVAANTLQ